MHTWDEDTILILLYVVFSQSIIICLVVISAWIIKLYIFPGTIVAHLELAMVYPTACCFDLIVLQACRLFIIKEELNCGHGE